MKRRISFRQHNVPYLPEKRIEEDANQLLAEWAALEPVAAQAPIQIEEMLESHLGLACLINDLQGTYDCPEMLGAIWFGDRMINIDQSLDPVKSPKLLGRYRFTIAHEIGHWRLHREHLMNDPTLQSLFGKNSEPAFVNRAMQNLREEIQANLYASYLLMPQQLVLQAWEKWRGSSAPMVITDLPVGTYHATQKANEEMAMDQFCKPLAAQFEVSAQAMRYRLQDLELLVRELQQRLF